MLLNCPRDVHLRRNSIVLMFSWIKAKRRMDIVGRFCLNFVATMVELSKTRFEPFHGIPGDEDESSFRKILQYPSAGLINNSGSCIPGATIFR